MDGGGHLPDVADGLLRVDPPLLRRGLSLGADANSDITVPAPPAAVSAWRDIAAGVARPVAPSQAPSQVAALTKRFFTGNVLFSKGSNNFIICALSHVSLIYPTPFSTL